MAPVTSLNLVANLHFPVETNPVPADDKHPITDKDKSSFQVVNNGVPDNTVFFKTGLEHQSIATNIQAKPGSNSHVALVLEPDVALGNYRFAFIFDFNFTPIQNSWTMAQLGSMGCRYRLEYPVFEERFHALNSPDPLFQFEYANSKSSLQKVVWGIQASSPGNKNRGMQIKWTFEPGGTFSSSKLELDMSLFGG